MTSRADLARTAMIRAAAEITAEEGLGSTTLSAVQQRAGQANKSAARYHFGSRDGLLDAVFETYMTPVNTHRRQLLEARAHAPLGHGDVAAIFVRPLAAETLGQPGSTFARFLVQTMTHPTLLGRVMENLHAQSVRDLLARFHATTPLPTTLATRRFNSLAMLTISTLAAWEGRLTPSTDVDLIVDDLVNIAAAVLDAPPTGEDRCP